MSRVRALNSHLYLASPLVIQHFGSSTQQNSANIPISTIHRNADAAVLGSVPRTELSDGDREGIHSNRAFNNPNTIHPNCFFSPAERGSGVFFSSIFFCLLIKKVSRASAQESGGSAISQKMPSHHKDIIAGSTLWDRILSRPQYLGTVTPPLMSTFNH